jgi:hypothetical protein
VQTHVLAELGAHDEARAALDALTRDRCAALPFDEEWLVSTCHARRHFGDALAMHDRIGARRWRALTEREAARLLGPR